MEVLVEERSGARETNLRRLLSSYELLSFDAAADFDATVRIYRRCRAAGVTPRRMIDCTIVAVAWCRGATLLSSDADMGRVAPHRDRDGPTRRIAVLWPRFHRGLDRLGRLRLVASAPSDAWGALTQVVGAPLGPPAPEAPVLRAPASCRPVLPAATAGSPTARACRWSPSRRCRAVREADTKAAGSGEQAVESAPLPSRGRGRGIGHPPALAKDYARATPHPQHGPMKSPTLGDDLPLPGASSLLSLCERARGVGVRTRPNA